MVRLYFDLVSMEHVRSDIIPFTLMLPPSIPKNPKIQPSNPNHHLFITMIFLIKMCLFGAMGAFYGFVSFRLYSYLLILMKLFAD